MQLIRSSMQQYWRPVLHNQHIEAGSEGNDAALTPVDYNVLVALELK